MKWQPIETAPKDGAEILAWRQDAGCFLAKWTCADDLLTEKECERLDEKTRFKEDWFYADFTQGERLEGDLVPTHWMPIPHGPFHEKNFIKGEVSFEIWLQELKRLAPETCFGSAQALDCCEDQYWRDAYDDFHTPWDILMESCRND